MRAEDFHLPPPPQGESLTHAYKCGRPGAADACPHGPGRSGKCPLAATRGSDAGRPVCRPRLTWYGRRRRFQNVALTLTAIAAVGIIWLCDASVWVRPGDLATPHAQILSNTSRDDACAACHTAASRNPLGDGHDRSTQSSLCLDCHHWTMPRSTAMLAHNLPRTVRDELRLASQQATRIDDAVGFAAAWRSWMPRTSIDAEQVACAVCHQEHRGSDANLSHLTDTQCQTCHNNRFGDFARSHPKWGQWPYGRGGHIAFDHRSHFEKHFPAKEPAGYDGIDPAPRRWDCATCHVRMADGELSRSVDYTTGCAECHDDALKTQASTGFDLIALPTLSAETIASASPSSSLERWPTSATGFMDGRVPAMTRLLTRHSSEVADAYRVSAGDLSRLDDRVDADRHAAVAIADAMVRLMNRLGHGGQNAIRQHAQWAGVDSDTLRSLLAQLPPQMIDGSIAAWQDTPTSVGRFDAATLLPGGGWYRDDVTFRLAYRGGGHDDATLRHLVEIVGDLSADDPLRRELLQSSAAKACVACHPAAVGPQPSWVSTRPKSLDGVLTKFSHAPHLNLPQLTDCRHCHQLQTASASPSDLQSRISTEFEDITPQDCAVCHHPTGAGDSCVTCHRYHAVHPLPTTR